MMTPALKKVCSFGEILFRFAVPNEKNRLDESKLSVYLGGAELNVANALASWNVPVKYCTAMPDNFISTQIENSLEEKKIDTSAIKKTGDRIGSYYLAESAEIKHAGVVYDRAHSSFSQLKVGMIDWEKVLEDCDWFHFSAIVPALNKNLVAVCHEALKVATQKGITISIDLNYRAKLWTDVKNIPAVIKPLVAQCDVVMGNIWSAQILLGTPLNDKVKDVMHQENCIEQANETSAAIFKNFPKVQFVANTFRFSDDAQTLYYGTLHTRLAETFQCNVSTLFKTEKVIDKVGSGDCFMAGLIYGALNNFEHQKIIIFAASAAFGKLQERGDATQQTVKEILNRMDNNFEGREEIMSNAVGVKIQERIEQQGILPLFYDDKVETCKAITETLYAAGIRCIEFTNRGKNALENFSALIELRNQKMPDLKIGIGTILSAVDALQYIAIRADFLVSPSFQKEISEVAKKNNIVWIPGCMTPTEINTAQLADCTMIKLFPGDVLGTNFIKAIRPLFPTLKFIITGGVEANPENIKSWYDAGAVAVGLGSKLITKEILKNKDYEQLKINTLLLIR